MLVHGAVVNILFFFELRNGNDTEIRLHVAQVLGNSHAYPHEQSVVVLENIAFRRADVGIYIIVVVHILSDARFKYKAVELVH